MRRLLITIATVAAVALLGGCADDANTPSADEAATVNGTAITVDRLNQEIATAKAAQQQQPGAPPVDDATLSRSALTQLIQQQVLLAGAKDEGVSVSDADVQKRLDEVSQQITQQSGKPLEQALADQKLTIDRAKELLRLSLLQTRLGEKLAPGRDAEAIKADIAAKPADYTRYDVRHVLVADEAKAKELRGKLDKGGDWKQVAKESTDTGSKDKGGEYKGIGKGDFVPEFEKSMVELGEQGGCKGKTGACTSPLSEPVKSQFGFHIIQVIGKRPATVQEVQAKESGQALQQKQQQAVGDWLKEHTTQAEIHVNPRFGTWDQASGTIKGRETAPRQPTPAPTPAPAAP